MAISFNKLLSGVLAAGLASGSLCSANPPKQSTVDYPLATVTNTATLGSGVRSDQFSFENCTFADVEDVNNLVSYVNSGRRVVLTDGQIEALLGNYKYEEILNKAKVVLTRSTIDTYILFFQWLCHIL